MLICPVCSCSNPDDSVSCEQCNSPFQGAFQTLAIAPDEQQTTEASSSVSAVSAGSAAAARRAFTGELAPGEIIADRYRILQRLGQGGMGTVYQALDRELDRVIALKIIRPDVVSSPTAIRRLKQETLLARQIAHRNVVRVFDLGIAAGVRFITMEFVEGETLRALMHRKGKLPADEAVVIMKQVCAGLQAAHAEYVIHRDLKPGNVIIGRDGRTRILDFGLARPAEDTGITRTGVLLGTPDYMSPEQALGQPADSRSDIFSLGVIFYEMLSGRLPFTSQTAVESFLMRTRVGAPPLADVEPSVSVHLARIVMRCLALDAARRYQSAQELLDDLSAPEGVISQPRSASGEAMPPGTMLGSRYRIEAEAGAGGMGRVYRATDLDLNRNVAIKVVREDLSTDPEALRRLKEEIALASRISHRNVLRIHDLGEADGVRFVSMAWAEGEDLEHLIRRAAPLAEERIVQLATEICQGLEAAHDQGIVHRDLKPTNVLLDAAGHACIADFGLAHSIEKPGALSPSGEVHGTPRYMAPEQVEAKPTDVRTDVYSLGLVLYEMATGRIPFKDDSVYQTMAHRLTERPKDPRLFNPAISERLSKVVLRCLEREPERRYQSAREVLVDLQRLSKPDVVTGTRRFSKWAYAAVAVAVIVAMGAYLWTRHRKEMLMPPANGRYIAVLPFRVVGADPELKYEAEGIADAISQRLLSLSTVHAVSPRAIEQVDSKQPEEVIARKIGANLILDGSVQGQGERIAVFAHINNTETHKQLWSKSFSGMREDLFTIEDEICTEVVSALKVTPTVAERERATIQPTQDINAYDLYLKGRDLLKVHRDAQGDSAALALFEQACAKDPGFALAWTGVADASLSLYGRKRESFWAEKALAAAREAAGKNDSLPEVHLALGSVYSATGRNAQAIDEIKRALQLEPNSDDGYIRLGRAYLAAGQGRAALTAFQKAVELNPYYWYNHDRLGTAYAQLGNNEEALKELHRAAELNTSAASPYNNMGVIYLHEGRWNDCIAMLRKVIALRPSANAYTNMGTAYFYQGKYSEAIEVDEKAAQMSPGQQVILGNLADAYRQAGQWSKAQATYDTAIELAYRQLEVNPRDASALGSLALYYARKGGTAQPPQLIAQARSLEPGDDTLMYDEAIVDALAGRKDDALKALARAFQNGFSVNVAESEPDLKSIRALTEFQQLVTQVRR
ncbi:MAG: protein kinase [Acidobacteriaceae bacterium]|nr:protein kinase [Acidobacteriaceae bacterium]